MENEEKKINIDETLNELSMDELEDIAGGRITGTGYAAVTAAVLMFKKKGYSKEHCIQAMTDGWNKGSTFRDNMTDGTDQDLNDMVNYINLIW